MTINLELDVLGDSLSGHASDGTGSRHDFLGWLGMVAAIDALLPSDTPPDGNGHLGPSER